eukprot:scaffold1096_cov171-Pinguiococcus_pyrenoidosus.AAC.4
MSRTPLHDAAERGDVGEVRRLVDEGVDKEARERRYGRTPLCSAARHGHLEVVQALLDRGADKEAADKDGWTPLHCAAENGHVEVVQALLDRGANKEAAKDHGWTPLHIAARNGHLEVVQALMDRGANKDSASKDGRTPLHSAAQNGHLKVVQALLDRRANKEAANNDGTTPWQIAEVYGRADVVKLLAEHRSLHDAAERGDVEEVMRLVGEGADKESQEEIDGTTPLLAAVEKGHLEVVQVLLVCGANKEAANNKGWTPLNAAAQKGQLEVVQALLDRGANMDAANNNGATPLCSAARHGHLEVVQALLHRGANMEAPDNNGATPLYVAAGNGHLEVVQALLDRGANKEAANKCAATPLHTAAQKGHLEVLQALLDCGANKEAANEDGWTPLFEAAEQGHLEVVMVLLNHGANKEARDCDGATPLEIADEQGHVDIVQVLRDDKVNVEALLKTAILAAESEKWVALRAVLPLIRPLPTKPFSFGDERCTLFHHIVRRGDGSVLDVALKPILKVIEDTDEDKMLKAETSEAVKVLLAVDERGRSALDALLDRIKGDERWEKLRDFIHRVKISSVAHMLFQRVPISPPRVHLCGPGGAGKTQVRLHLMMEREEADALKVKDYVDGRTRGVEITRTKLLNPLSRIEDGVDVQIFDHGGQKNFQLTYVEMLSKPLSIFVVVVPINPGRGNTNADAGRAAPPTTTPMSCARELRYWLSMLETVANPDSNRVLVIANNFEGTTNDEKEDHERAIRGVLLEYLGMKEQLETEQQGQSTGIDNAEDLTWSPRGRLSLFWDRPVSLCATSSGQCEKIYDHVKACWSNMRGPVGAAEQSTSLSMPVLCFEVVQVVPTLRLAGSRIQKAAEARATLRMQLTEQLQLLEDGALDAVLGYVEQCGEVLLYSTDEGLSVVIWDPNWFCSIVLGKFFQPADWMRGVGGNRSNRMHHEDVKELLHRNIQEAGEGVQDDETLEILVAMIEAMRLCVPVGNAKEEWFPAVINTADTYKGYEKAVARAHLREQMSPSKIILEKFKLLSEESLRNGFYSGRLVSLLNFSSHGSRTDDLWQIFPSGTFSRFQARILEAFPDPVDEDDEFDDNEEDQGMLFTAQEGPQRELGRPYLSRNFVKVVWEGDAANEYAIFQCLMLHDNDAGLEIGWMAWFWASNEEAAAHLLEAEMEHEEDKSMVLLVMQQMMKWLLDAASFTAPHVKPKLRSYRLKAQAFLKSGSTILEEGSENFLSMKKKENHAYSSVPTETKEDDDQSVRDLVRNVGMQVHTVSRQMAQLAMREHALPCTPLLLPAELAAQIQILLTGRTDIRKGWVADKYYLFFVCPVTGRIAPTNGGKGYELKVLKEKFKPLAKAFAFSMALIKIGVVAATLAAGVGAGGAFIAGLLPASMLGDDSTYSFESLQTLAIAATAVRDVCDDAQGLQAGSPSATFTDELIVKEFAEQLQGKTAETFTIHKPC